MMDVLTADLFRAGWEVGKSVYHGKKHFVQPYGSQFI